MFLQPYVADPKSFELFVFGITFPTNVVSPVLPFITMSPPLEKSFETMVQSYLLGVGHGWSFIGKDKHYWNLEFMLYKGILVKHGVITNELFYPKLNYQTSGGQFRLSYHF